MFYGFEAVPGAIVPYEYDWPMVGLSYLISVVARTWAYDGPDASATRTAVSIRTG